jgi:hypothetical protein
MIKKLVMSILMTQNLPYILVKVRGKFRNCGSCCDRSIWSRFSVVFFSPRANAELIPKFHVALHASHAALPMVTSKFRPNLVLPKSYKIHSDRMNYLYQKDKRALPGNLQTRRYNFLSPSPKYSVSQYLPTFSLSLVTCAKRQWLNKWILASLMRIFPDQEAVHPL